MRTFARVVLFALTYVGVFVAAAEADIRYSYVGDTFGLVQGVYTQADRITGNFVLSDSFVPALVAGPQNVTSSVVSYSFTDGHQTLTQGNSTGSFNVGFILSEPIVPGTVGAGAGAWWFFDLLTPTSGIHTVFGGDFEATAWIGAAQPSGFHNCGTAKCYDDPTISQATINTFVGGISGTRGKWTIERVAMPEAGGIALFLFTNLAGLTILALFIGLKRVRRGF